MAEVEEKKEESVPKKADPEFIFVLRDINKEMVKAWQEVFTADNYKVCFEISKGDIFKNAPQADTIVSPANSFGFMDGGIDMAYSMHFGWQMQNRLQEVLRSKHDGECLVGKCVIISAYPPDQKLASLKDTMEKNKNEGEPIRYLISAPTMRVPRDVSDTCNAYLAFRGVILAARKFNRKLKENGDKLGLGPIKRILCPGLGTAVGRMPAFRCAYQMKEAFDVFVLGQGPDVINPNQLEEVSLHHHLLVTVSSSDENKKEKKEKK